MTNKKEYIILKPRAIGRLQEFLESTKNLLESGETITIVGDSFTMPKLEQYCKFKLDWKNATQKNKIIRNTFIVKKK